MRPRMNHLTPGLLLAGVLVAAVTLSCETDTPRSPVGPSALAPAASHGPLDRIAFESNRPDGHRDIYVINEDGSGETRLTSSTAEEREPAFSPDGQRIAFSSDADGDFDIYVMDDDGSNVVQLTNDPGTDAFPAFSPDGGQIVFESDRDGEFDVYVMDAATGGGVTRLTGAAGDDLLRDHQPEFSRDGGRITFFRSSFDPTTPFANAIFVLDLTSGDLDQVSVDDLQANGFPTFSPDGTRVAFQGFLGSLSEPSDVWTVNATEPPPGDILNDRFRVTGSLAGDNGHPSYDPDEDRIAFAHGVGPPTFDTDIFLINADGTDPVNVTQSGGGISTNPSFGPPANPASMDDCKNGGWQRFGFRNQGLCIQFVTTGKDSR